MRGPSSEDLVMNAGTQHPGRLQLHDSHNSKRKRRRRTTSRWVFSFPSVVLWVTLLSSGWRGPSLAVVGPVVNAQEESMTTTTSTLDEERSDVDMETDEIMNAFLKTLRLSSYLDLIVQATHEKKPVNSNRGGPPVMIGRRRSLMEHSLHHHYSVQYLQQLKKRRTSTTTISSTSSSSSSSEDSSSSSSSSEDSRSSDEEQKQQQQAQNQKREAELREVLNAFLYLTPLEAHVKANPQRQQHNSATSNMVGMPPFPPSASRANAQLLKDMFYRSYNAYMEHSFPAAELLPLTCQPGTFDLVRLPALTLIDALDTLIVLGDSLEFAKSVERLRAFHREHLKSDGSGGIFAVNQNVSLFETTIRVLGGLLSAHQMAVAYLRNQQQPDRGAQQQQHVLPPVFLKDVFDSTSADVYLQPPEHVQRILEQHAQKYLTDTKGTCTVANPAAKAGNDNNPEDLEIHHADNNHHSEVVVDVNSNHEDWREHCGAGVLALEDCAASKAPKNNAKQQQQQAVNQTVARLQKERLLREPQWEYDGFLLDLALDIGERLLPAFDTRTGIPYGTVNLLSGVPSGETTVASLAGGGTLSLEMELLSRLTGDLRFGRAAKLAIRALWVRRSNLNLLGKHIDIQRGTWTENLSGIGSNSDSFLEYLLKHYLLFPEEEDFWTMLQAAYTGIFKDARLGEWYADVDMKTGKQAWPKGMIKRVLESLMAFYPGMQTLLGEHVPAARSLNSFFMVREFLGFLPERFSYSNWKVDGGISSGAAKYPLRPELLESCYFMHRVTKKDGASSEASSSWQWAADFALHHLERLTRAKCGYASVRGLNPSTGSLHNYQHSEHVKLFNEMPSFFLSETIKYLYLTFDDDNIIHKDKDREWIFTTEAHPIHHVPTFEQQQESTQKDEEEDESVHLAQVKDRLRKKLKVLKYHKAHRTFSSSRSKPPTDNLVSAYYLAEELWADNTQPRKYRGSIKEVIDEIYTSEEQNTYDPEWHPVKSFFGEEVTMVDPMQQQNKEHLYEEDNNLAHMTWSSVGVGSGYGLRKACPNTYAPELTWLHALNGGALDYTDIYVTSMSESDGDYPFAETVHLLVTSAEALSVHGSGVYLGMMDSSVQASEQCPIVPQANNAHTRATDSTSTESSPEQLLGETSNDVGDEDVPEAAIQHVELAGLGTFEIKAFPEGSGFIMKHMDSGESIMATFIADAFDGISAQDVTLMVYASMPRTKMLVTSNETDDIQESSDDSDDVGYTKDAKDDETPVPTWRRVGPRLASLFKKKNPNTDEVPHMEPGEPERAVVIADLHNHAFHCDVNIIRRPLSMKQDSDYSTTETEDNDDARTSTNADELVATVPCAPALFGPTLVSKLVESNGALIERPIFPPNEADEFGCGTQDGEEIPTVTPVREKEPRSNEDNFSEVEAHDDNAADDQSGSCENKTIQLVQRGECSFYAKAANQKKHVNAEGVIVINNDDLELFIMSNGGDEDVGVSEEEIPVSVLVTGMDGETLLGVIQSESLASNDETYMLAQISIYKQDPVVDDTGNLKQDSEDIAWPIVRGSGEALQILAEGGWGIHAMRKDGGSIKSIQGSNDLQIFLLKHSD